MRCKLQIKNIFPFHKSSVVTFVSTKYILDEYIQDITHLAKKLCSKFILNKVVTLQSTREATL